MSKGELLLPVGNTDMCLAAIHNGADAVYIGMPYFNARGRTTDFELEQLKEMIDLCHLYGVDVHIAFNVLIFEEEIPRAVSLLKDVIDLGPDAFIVQDLGLIKLINQIAPEQVVHASTQMTISNFEAIDFLDDLSIDRFVLARECSLKEIQKIRDNTQKELEVFVHGALCVSYSGQCFTSEAIGGRSANRGQCAQSCRFDYQLVVDGQKKNLIDKKYLVSPKDLCGLNEIKDLQKMGVDSFKVEGRLKAPEYVASAAKSYKDIMLSATSEVTSKYHELSRTFSRGFFSGWLHGVDHQQLVEGTYGNHRGLELGKVVKTFGGYVYIKSDYVPNAGDGVLFVSKDFEVGANIYQVKREKDMIALGIDKKVDLSKIKSNMRVFLNKDTKLEKDLKKTFTDKQLLKRIPLSIEVSGKEGERLTVAASTKTESVAVKSVSDLQQAKSSVLNVEGLKKDLGSLGHTCFVLEDLSAQLEGDLFLNQKELKNIKRSIVDSLYEKRVSMKKLDIKACMLPKSINSAKVGARLNILLRDKDQFDWFCEYFKSTSYKDLIGDVILDFEFGKDYEPSVKKARENGISIYIATTRILKPFEYHNLRQIIRCNPDGVVVRNLGAINFLQKEAPHLKLKGDFSLNATNSVTVDYLISKGLESICAGHDLNQIQLQKLLENTDANKLEITVHQYMPEFHMEHCIFAAFLSKGSSFKDCGKPCEKHQVEMVDMYGNHHFLKADQECRNTMFMASPQAATSLIPDWLNLGVGLYRFESLFESKEDLISKIDAYLQVLSGKLSPSESFKKLNLIEKFGVNTGQLTFADNYQDIKK